MACINLVVGNVDRFNLTSRFSNMPEAVAINADQATRAPGKDDWQFTEAVQNLGMFWLLLSQPPKLKG